MAPHLRLVMPLAVNTGQRQGDLLKLPWSAYDGKTNRIRQKKTGTMPLFQPLTNSSKCV
jgi:integrase